MNLERPLPGAAADARRVPVIRFFDPDLRDGHQDLDLSDWRSRPQFEWALASFLALKGSGDASGTRNARLKGLRPFLKYLDAEWPQVVSLGDLTNEVVSGYVAWLAKGRAAAKNGPAKPWTDATKRMRYKAVIAFLRHCRRHKRIAAYLDPTLRIVGTHPWSGADASLRPRRALTKPELRAIVNACLREIEITIRRLRIGADIRADDTIKITRPREPSTLAYRDFRVKLRTVIERHGDRIPRGPVLKRLDPGLFRSMVPPHGTLAATGKYLHFTPRTLTPFVLLLAIQTLHNPDAILRLRWSDVEESDDLHGPERWTVFGRKGRSTRLQARSFSASVKGNGHAVALLKALRELSAPTRRLVPERFRDCVFIFMQTNQDRFSGFERVDGASGAGAWSHSLKRFIGKHGLAPFALANIRPTAGEILDVMTIGDLKAIQRQFGHASAATTDDHYLSENVRRRSREDLAAGVALIERYASTGGGADARRGTSVVADLSAATPGFTCVAPLRSPIPFQREGRLCAAYGECPTCPLASVDPEDARAYRRMLQIRDMLVEARGRVHPSRWVQVLQPRLQAMDAWLSFFSEAAKTASRSLAEPLPLPAFE